jgi:hypothetical protein
MMTTTNSTVLARRSVEERLLLSAIGKSSGARRTELIGLLSKLRASSPVARPASSTIQKVTRPSVASPTLRRVPVTVETLCDAGAKLIKLAEGGGPLAAEAEASLPRIAKAIIGLEPDAALAMVPRGEAGSVALIKASFKHPRRLFA